MFPALGGFAAGRSAPLAARRDTRLPTLAHARRSLGRLRRCPTTSRPASTRDGSLRTSRSSWTATAAGRSVEGLKRTDGHTAAEEALFDTVEGALDVGMRWMTVYAFSTENWRRPIDEVRFLMRFNEELLMRRRDDLNSRGVRIRFIGRRWRSRARGVSCATSRTARRSPSGTAG